MSNNSRSVREPLAESPTRINHRPQRPSNTQPIQCFPTQDKPNIPLLQPGQHATDSRLSQKANVHPRVIAIAEEAENTKAKRSSQVSTTSTTYGQIKQCVGPWQLGKTLGSGASARVRLARNIYTQQQVAVKIIAKGTVGLSQAGSLASLDREDRLLPVSSSDMRRMPYMIEREVAIMKLIQHPHIITLLDIWENRNEIYLVLEYVNGGELFDAIVGHGRLEEEDAIKLFRQIVSAVGYCHSLNICHRDIKAENILLTKCGQIKMADFGMAALHQTPNHKLTTSCGSPHYAAPELIRGGTYKGNTVDIWSMGVVLFATLAGRLPFDVEGTDRKWLQPLLAKIRKGVYKMPEDLSDDAKSFIRSILTVNPKDRLTVKDIWNHRLIRKYDHLDDLSQGGVPLYPQSPSSREFERPVARRGEIQKDLVRSLRSMWHALSEDAIINALLADGPNEQKVFYTLLVKFQENLQENYHTELNYSASDYHHVRPARLTKTYSTCHFPTATSGGHARQESKFTVFSNVAETVRSYDPFRASRPQNLNGRQQENFKITIHRDPSGDHGHGVGSRQTSRASTAAGGSARGKSNTLMVPNKSYASRSSMASSVMSRNIAVRASVGHGKRGVAFNHQRKGSVGNTKNPSSGPNDRHSNFTEVTDDGGDYLRRQSVSKSTAYIRSRKPQTAGLEQNHRGDVPWIDDMRSGLEKDCDEAFNHVSAMANGDRSCSSQKSSRTPGSSSATTKLDKAEYDSRPLPAPPARTESVKAELMGQRKQAELRAKFGQAGSPGYLKQKVMHLDRLIHSGTSPVRPHHARRTASAPVAETRQFSGRPLPLPSIYEQRGEDSFVRNEEEVLYKHRSEPKQGRVASAPEAWETFQALADSDEDPSPAIRQTIRVVQPSSVWSPVKIPSPLRVRKKESIIGRLPMMTGGHVETMELPPGHVRMTAEEVQRLSYNPDLSYGANLRHMSGEDVDQFANKSNNSNTDTVLRKKSSWFKRGSKGSDDLGTSVVANLTFSSNGSDDRVQDPYERPSNPHLASSIIAVSPPRKSKHNKKNSFNLGRWLKKRNSKSDIVVAEDDDAFEDGASCRKSIMDSQPHQEDGSNRQIADQRNWFAKLFKVKPVTRYLCFTISKREARRAIFQILKGWKKYGIKDIQVDKKRNMVFAKVGPKNSLNLKPVAFAAETMRMVEHSNRKQKLTIVRFTQEQGAASSLIKVIDHMDSYFHGDVHAERPCVLVTDDEKIKMMIQTAKSLF